MSKRAQPKKAAPQNYTPNSPRTDMHPYWSSPLYQYPPPLLRLEPAPELVATHRHQSFETPALAASADSSAPREPPSKRVSVAAPIFFTTGALIRPSISNAELQSLPTWSYGQPVFVVRSVKQIPAAIYRLLGCESPLSIGPDKSPLLGLDIEWKPMFSPGEYNTTSLLQLYAPNRAVIFRLNDLMSEQTGKARASGRFEFPVLLRQLLENPHIRKSGLGIRDDAERLKRDFGIETRGCLDIKDLPVYAICRPKSMVGLAGIFLGIRISKAQATSNWENPRLTQTQISYAATDAYLSRELYIAMSSAGTVNM